MTDSPDTSSVARFWDEHAEGWSASLRSGRDQLNEDVNIPAFLNLLGDVAGLRLLDVGCGEGRSSRHLARAGAKVTGIDLSSGMIRQAQNAEAEMPLGISYVQGTMSDLSMFDDNAFDGIVSIMALMDAPEYSKSLAGFRRVIRPGGFFAFLVLHPCFFTSRFEVLRSAAGEALGILVGNYFSEKPYRQTLPLARRPQDEPAMVPRFPRTLSAYINGLLTAGFILTGFTETRPSAAQAAHHKIFAAWRRHAPICLGIKARNP